MHFANEYFSWFGFIFNILSTAAFYSSDVAALYNIWLYTAVFS